MGLCPSGFQPPMANIYIVVVVVVVVVVVRVRSGY